LDLYKFPRELTSKEKKILYSVLPESKSGYNLYRNKIKDLVVIGSGRFKNRNFILGKAGVRPDLDIPSSPVFALGTLIVGTTDIDVVIHEEQYNQIEFDITSTSELELEADLVINEIRCFSDWNPRDKIIFGEHEVKELTISPDLYILAIVPDLKKIFLHDTS
jgi:hypothetical protein